MAKLTQTVQEARDFILKRVGGENSTDWQSLVLTLLNHALVSISAAHDWEYLRKKGTLTTTDATGIVELPSDLDRILAIHAAGSSYVLAKVEAVEMEQIREDDNVDESVFWCAAGYAQDTSVEAPNMQIEVYTAPASGATFTIWYVKHIDELSTLSSVPNIPPHIWDLVIQRAMLEALKMDEKPHHGILTQEKHLMAALGLYKTREEKGSSKRGQFAIDEKVASYLSKRFD